MSGASLTVASEFVMVMMNARTEAHIHHLKTRSYAAHMALGDFYKEIGDLVDRLAENLQGKYGPLDYAPLSIHLSEDGKEMMRNLNDYVFDSRDEVSSASDIQNIIDEIEDLVSRTNYKLNFLS